jgi:hypothetical protein
MMAATLPDTGLSLALDRFRRRRFLAFPLAGTLAWAAVGVAGLFLSGFAIELFLFCATGVIVYLGLGLSRFTGEHAASRGQPRNTFDTLFFLAVGSALLVYAIAIPFYLIEPTSLPLSVGILTGLMWLPTSWLIGHWVGVFHAVVRSLGTVVLWYAWPDLRFVAIPFFIVGVYAVTIVALERRWRDLNTPRSAVGVGYTHTTGT